MRLSLSDLALRIKILKVNIGTSIEDVLSRALDPPAQINVQRAVSALVEACIASRITMISAKTFVAAGQSPYSYRRYHANGTSA
jgi:hypothetical protein